MSPLDKLLADSKEIPPLPEIYIRVSELLEADHTTAQEIGDALQTDPSLTTKMLKMLNSAFYGLSSEVTSVPQAVTLLGRQQLKNMLMGSVLSGLFSDMSSDSFSMHDFWQHSIKTAIIARHLALQSANVIDHDAFFTAGLLHDIGRLVIADKMPDSIADIELLMNDAEIDIVLAENNILGFTHMDVSKAIMTRWKLPSMLIQCAIKHHNIHHEGPFAIDTCIVYLANKLSVLNVIDDEDDLATALDNIENWQQTQCSLEQITVACQLAEEQSQEVMESLGMMDLPLSDE